MSILEGIFNYFNQKTTEKDLSDTTVQLSEIHKLEKTNIDELRKVSPELTEAAENGDPKAFEKLGDVFKEGKGVEKNLEKAMELYEKALLFGQRQAKEEATSTVKTYLQEAYGKHKAEKLLKESEKSINYLTRYIEKYLSPNYGEESSFYEYGETDCERKLQHTYFEMIKTEPKVTYEHILREADKGNKVAQYLIGHLSFDSNLEEQKDIFIHNDYLAIENLGKSARQGYINAFLSLVDIYETNKNLEYANIKYCKGKDLLSDSMKDVENLIVQSIKEQFTWLFARSSTPYHVIRLMNDIRDNNINFRNALRHAFDRHIDIDTLIWRFKYKHHIFYS